MTGEADFAALAASAPRVKDVIAHAQTIVPLSHPRPWLKTATAAGAAALIAAAIFLRSRTMLYGRYWGSAAHEDCLHFEACYYRGIEYCIARGPEAFDPGTQGEHKLARGFEPTQTSSAHWLNHDAFRDAVAGYLERERAAVAEYISAAAGHLPFQRGPAP